MEVRVVNTPSAGRNNDPVHCFVAIELSKSNWVVGFQTLCVPKIRFCNIGDEGRRGQAVM